MSNNEVIMTPERMMALHAGFTHERANVVIPKQYLELVEWDYIAAIVLRELVAFTVWSHDKKDREGWWYRTEAEWEEKLRLSQKQVNRCIVHINNLANETVVEKKPRKIRLDDGTMLNKTATHYRVDSLAFIKFYENRVDSSRNLPNGSSHNCDEGGSEPLPDGSSLTYTKLTTKPIEQERENGVPNGTQPEAVTENPDESLSGLEGFQSTLKKNGKSPTPPAPPSRKKDDRRVWAMVDAYFEARGLVSHKMPDDHRSPAYSVFAKIVDEFNAQAIYGCTSYLASQQWWQEAGRLTAKAVSNTIFDWDAKGRPTAEAPRSGQGTAIGFAGTFQSIANNMKESGL